MILFEFGSVCLHRCHSDIILKRQGPNLNMTCHFQSSYFVSILDHNKVKNNSLLKCTVKLCNKVRCATIVQVVVMTQSPQTLSRLQICLWQCFQTWCSIKPDWVVTELLNILHEMYDTQYLKRKIHNRKLFSKIQCGTYIHVSAEPMHCHS